jgi:hypothetical protein
MAKESTDEKKNQHFVTRSFLKGFTIDGEESLIWGYDKKLVKCTGKRSIDRICSSSYYYEQPTPDGGKTQILEDGFQEVETIAIKIIRNLSTFQNLSPDDKGRLAFYIGLLLTRGPSFRDGIHEFHKHHSEIILQKEYEFGRLPEPPEILKEHIINNDITSVLKTIILPHVSLRYMFDWAVNISQSLCHKKWNIYYIENDEFFVTSDTPVMFELIDLGENRSIDPTHHRSLVLCPITNKMLIAAMPYCKTDCSSYEYKPIRVGMPNRINKLMCFYVQRFIYSPEQSQELLDYIKEAKGYCKKFKAYRLGDAVIPQWDVYIEQSE